MWLTVMNQILERVFKWILCFNSCYDRTLLKLCIYIYRLNEIWAKLEYNIFLTRILFEQDEIYLQNIQLTRSCVCRIFLTVFCFCLKLISSFVVTISLTLIASTNVLDNENFLQLGEAFTTEESHLWADILR